MEDGAGSQQTAKIQFFAFSSTDGGNDAHSGGFGINHANGSFVGNDTGDDIRRCIAGDDDHIQSDGADGRHSFQFFDGQGAAAGGSNHAGIFGHRDKGAGQTADVAGCHQAAFFDSIIEHGQRGSRAAGTALLQSDFFKNVGDGIADGRRRCEGQIHNAEGNAECFACFSADQLSHAGYLEGSSLDHVGDSGKVGCIIHLGQCRADDAGAAYAHIDDAVRFAGAVEGARHKGIILRCIAEDNQLGGTDALPVAGQFRGSADDGAHGADGIHVDAGLGAADIDRGTDELCFGKSLRDRGYQRLVAGGKAFLGQGGVTADEVDADGAGSLIQCSGILDRIAAGDAGQHSDRRNGYPFVDNGNAVFFFDGFSYGYQVSCLADDLFIDLFTCFVDVCIGTVQQGDAHGGGADVQIFVLDHPYGF